MENRDYVVGIDIGSSSLVMAVGVCKQGGELSILGVDVQKVERCVEDGDITNCVLLGEAIARSKSALENELNIQLGSAYVGFSGRSVYCVRYEDYVYINGKNSCVTDVEMRELNSRIEMVASGGGDVIIDRILLRYTIDDRQDVDNPLGSFGRKLSATYLFVMAGRYQIERIKQAMHRADIDVKGICVNPTLLPDLLLTPYEKEEGVAIIDLGSDLTDLSIVRNGKLWHFSSLPIGSSSINNDLYEFMKISKKDIDPLKHKYGSALAESVPADTSIPVRTAGHVKKQILQRNIAEIAEERLKDIAQFVMREMKHVKLSSKVPCGVVLTGGASYLSNIDQLFARELKMNVRLAEVLNGLDDESQQCVSAPLQSSVLGLLLYGSKHSACEANQRPARTKIEMAVKEQPNDKEVTPVTQDTSNVKTTETMPKTMPETMPETTTETTTPETTGTTGTTPETTTGIVAPPEGETIKTTSGEQPKLGIISRLRDWLDKKFEDDDLL